MSLHSLQEEHFVLNLAHNHTGFWIGLNDEDGPSAEHREGSFKWTSGEEPSSYCRWKPGEPNNKRHLDCVKADVEGWAMAPGGCATSRLPFVCKKTGECGLSGRLLFCISIATVAKYFIQKDLKYIHDYNQIHY